MTVIVFFKNVEIFRNTEFETSENFKKIEKITNCASKLMKSLTIESLNLFQTQFPLFEKGLSLAKVEKNKFGKY